MIEVLLGLMLLAIVALVVVVLRRDQPEAESTETGPTEAEKMIADLLKSQQSLVGKVELVSTQQVESSRNLTESFGRSQKELSEALTVSARLRQQ